jgi:hypothetical protein
MTSFYLIFTFFTIHFLWNVIIDGAMGLEEEDKKLGINEKTNNTSQGKKIQVNGSILLMVFVQFHCISKCEKTQ